MFKLFITFFIFFLHLSLCNFNPYNQNFFQNNWRECNNYIFFEYLLSYLPSLFFYIFGKFSYFIIIIYFFLNKKKKLFKKKKNIPKIILGIFLLIISLCSIIHLCIKDFYYFFSGGIIGYSIVNYLLLFFNKIFTIIIIINILILSLIIIFDIDNATFNKLLNNIGLIFIFLLFIFILFIILIFKILHLLIIKILTIFNFK